MRTLAICALTIAATSSLAPMPARAASKIEDTEAKANGLVDKGKIDDAVKALEKLQKDPSPEAQVAVSRVLNRAGKVDDALHAAQAALEGSTSSAAELRARVLAQLASVELRTASSLDALAHAEAAAAITKSPEILATVVLARARTKDPQALPAAEALLKAAPKSAAAHDARGEALAAARRLDEADAEFTSAIQLDPKLYLTHVHQAMARLEAGRVVDAERLADGATKIDPAQPEGWAVLAAARITKNPTDWKAAAEPAQQAVFLAPNSAYALYWRGKILDGAGNPQEATGVYNAAAKADPGFGKARLAALGRITNDEAAIVEAAKLADELPHDGEVQWKAGEVLVLKKDYAGALEPLERAVAINPKNGNAAASLAEAYRGNHQYARASEKYHQALDLVPDNGVYQRLYAITLAASRQCGTAGPLVKRLAPKQPPADAGNMYFWLGWCQFQVARDAKNKNGVLDALDTARKAKPLLAAEDKRAIKLINLINDWLSNVRRFQGTPPPPPVVETCDLGQLGELAKAGEESIRVRAIRQMVCAGADAVKYLVSYIGDPNVVVKRAAVRTLGDLGAPARTACQYLTHEIESSQSRMLPSADDAKRTPQEQLQRLTNERLFQEAAQATMTKVCKK